MICDQCGKNTAIILFAHIVHNTKTVLRLCEDCAKSKGLPVSSKEESSASSDLVLEALKEAISSKDQHLICPACGTSYGVFKKTGRLGCGTCYETFSSPLAVLFRRIHDHDRHIGKSPKEQPSEGPRQQEIFVLRERLRTAVEKEAFEEAAQLRDRIAGMGSNECTEA